MACHDQAFASIEEIEKKALASRLDKVTRIFCSAVRRLKEQGIAPETFLDQEGQGWWADHEKADAARLERESVSGAREAQRVEPRNE